MTKGGHMLYIGAVIIDLLILLDGWPFFHEWYQQGFRVAAQHSDWIFFGPLVMVVVTIWLVTKQRELNRLQLAAETAAYVADRGSLPRTRRL